jgi:glycosyltransferase involved in cell wall biosynthesis
MPKFLKKADVILPVSNHVKEELYKHYPLLDSEVRVLYNALPSNYEKLNSEVDDNKSMMEDYFIVVGSINKRKNTLKVLQAFNDFIKKSSKPFKIVFAGSRMGEQSNELIRIWEKLVKEERLIHLQNLNDREMISYIKGARALIFASLYEGFGFPILEAYACGIPLITSNVSSMPEVAGKGALFVQPNEVNSISSAMFQIHEDEGLRKRLIAEGKNQIQKFNWEKSVEGLHDSLMWAAGQRNKIK